MDPRHALVGGCGCVFLRKVGVDVGVTRECVRCGAISEVVDVLCADNLDLGETGGRLFYRRR